MCTWGVMTVCVIYLTFGLKGWNEADLLLKSLE